MNHVNTRSSSSRGSRSRRTLPVARVIKSCARRNSIRAKHSATSTDSRKKTRRRSGLSRMPYRGVIQMAGFRHPRGDKTEVESIGSFVSLCLWRLGLLVRPESHLFPPLARHLGLRCLSRCIEHQFPGTNRGDSSCLIDYRSWLFPFDA